MVNKCYMVEKIYHKKICVYHMIELWENSTPSVVNWVGDRGKETRGGIYLFLVERI